MLRDVIADALSEVDEVEVLAGEEGESLEQSVDRLRARVVLVESRGAELTEPYLRLMYRHPRLKLLALSSDGRRAALYRLAPRRRFIGKVSPRGLAEAIRATARSRPETEG